MAAGRCPAELQAQAGDEPSEQLVSLCLSSCSSFSS